MWPLTCVSGMLALEMLGRRAHNDHPNNFSRSPPYTEDVKWLLGLAARLGEPVDINVCHHDILHVDPVFSVLLLGRLFEMWLIFIYSSRIILIEMKFCVLWWVPFLLSIFQYFVPLMKNTFWVALNVWIFRVALKIALVCLFKPLLSPQQCVHRHPCFSSPLFVRSELCLSVLCGRSQRSPQSICPAGDHHGGPSEAKPCPCPCPPANTCLPPAGAALPAVLPAGLTQFPSLYAQPKWMSQCHYLFSSMNLSSSWV